MVNSEINKDTREEIACAVSYTFGGPSAKGAREDLL